MVTHQLQVEHRTRKVRRPETDVLPLSHATIQIELESDFYRAMLCIRGTSHGPVSVRPYVCLSVRPSQAGVLLKRQNVGSHKQHHSFLVPKISAKFDQGHPLRGRQMQVGWVKIGDFRQIAGYISKMVKDRHIVCIKVE